MKKSEAIEALIKAGSYVAASHRDYIRQVSHPDIRDFVPYSANEWDDLLRKVQAPSVKPALSTKDKRIAELEAQVQSLLRAGDMVVRRYVALRKDAGEAPPWVSVTCWDSAAKAVRGV